MSNSNKINKVALAIYCLTCMFLLCIPLLSLSQVHSIPWLNKIDPENISQTIHSISAEADVSVSDGLEFQVKTLFHDKQRAIFQRIYKDNTITQGIDGKYIWQYDDQGEQEINAFFNDVILGHQFHAQILFFDKLYEAQEPQKRSTFNDIECSELSAESNGSIYKLYFDKSGIPLGIKLLLPDNLNIEYQYDNWQDVGGISIPYTIFIDDGSREFTYNFKHISLNKGSFNTFRAPNSLLTDEQKLLRLHREIMDAHYFENPEALKELKSDSIVIVSAGEIINMTAHIANQSFDQMLGNREYFIYDDLVRPIVSVSKDGTLGWVIVQVYAKGIRLDETGNQNGPLEFVSSWIELYEKVGTEWKMKGNVSNFQAERL